MKYKIILMASLCALIASCGSSSVTQNAFNKELRKQGWVPMHPQGSPSKIKSWKKYGPGAIARPGSKGELYWADQIIGSDGVIEAYSDKEPYAMENWSKIKSYNVSLDGELTGVIDTKDKDLFKRVGATAITVSYGATTRSAPLTIVQMSNKFNQHKKIDSLTKKALRLKQAHYVYDVLYTNDLKFTLGKYNENNVFIPIQINPEIKATVAAGGYSISGSTLQSTKPIFIAYRPIPRERLHINR